MTIRAVIFVLDELIRDFNIDQMTMKAEVRSHLVKEGIPASVLLTNESMFDMLKKTEIFMKNSGKSTRLVMKIQKHIWNLAQQHELEAAKTASVVPGILEMLETLKRARLKLGLFTTIGEKSVNYIFKRFGISKFFNSVTSREKVKNVELGYEHLDSTIKTLHVKSEEALVVTNDEHDIISGRELGAMVAALATETSAQKRLVDAGANYFISSVLEVPELVETINKSPRFRRTRNRKMP